jgi:hypothetical protein
VAMLSDFADAAAWCRAEVCTATVDKVPVEHNRWWINPCGWICGQKYTVMQCPAGSAEAALNEGGLATREPNPVVELPDPPPGKPFQWPLKPVPGVHRP